MEFICLLKFNKDTRIKLLTIVFCFLLNYLQSAISLLVDRTNSKNKFTFLLQLQKRKEKSKKKFEIGRLIVADGPPASTPRCSSLTMAESTISQPTCPLCCLHETEHWCPPFLFLHCSTREFLDIAVSPSVLQPRPSNSWSFLFIYLHFSGLFRGFGNQLRGYFY